MEPQKPFLIIQDAKKNEDNYSEELELPENVVITEQMGNFALQNPSWLPRQDSNL